jgi:hypothetical protein
MGLKSQLLLCLALVSAGGDQSVAAQSDRAFALQLEQEYGRARYESCQMVISGFERNGSVHVRCVTHTRSRASVEAARQLTLHEIDEIQSLASDADLCGGGYAGRDFTPSDGVFETLRAECQDGRVVILVTSGNPTFEANRARAKLLERLHSLRQQLQPLLKRASQ